jgi:hypothetical protein
MILFQPHNAGISCGRVRRPGGPARRVLRRRRDGSGRQLHAELGGSPISECLTVTDRNLCVGKDSVRRCGRIKPADWRGLSRLGAIGRALQLGDVELGHF